MEAVGVGRDAAHGVHADGPADHLVVAPAGPIRPGDVERDLLFEGGVRQLGGDAAHRGGGDAGLLLGALGGVGVGQEALGEQLEYRNCLAAVGQPESAGERGRQITEQAAGELAGGLVVHQRSAGRIAGEQAIVGRARGANDQPGRVGVANQVVEIDLLGVEQLVDERAGK